MDRNFDSIDVASYIAKWCGINNVFVNITKLQKLLFCVYGSVLAVTDNRLCKEHPKAWPHGPVFPRVYTYTKRHQLDIIDALIKHKQAADFVLSQEEKDVIDSTLKLFGKYNAGQLVAWTHKTGSPWYESTNGGLNLQKDIPDPLIKDYFQQHVWVIDHGN